MTREFATMKRVNKEKYLLEKVKGNVATINANTDRIEVHDNVCQKLTALIDFGATTQVSKYYKAHPLLSQKEPVKLMDELMTIAINDNPSDIGKPINIVEVSEKGINWIRKKS